MSVTVNGVTLYDTLLLDQTAWDLVLDANGNIAMASPSYSLAQDVASAVRTFLGEVWYSTIIGVPYWQEILGKLPPASLLTEIMNQQALTVPGVVTVQTVVQSFSGRNVGGQIQFVDASAATTVVNF